MTTSSTTFESSDSRLLAYGREVNALLSSDSADGMADELWTMFSGYMLAQKELGHCPEIANTFFTFKDLLLFFEKIERIRSAG
ncbi:MAG: hypothetical protein J7619_18470 [Dyadobacter sp.]|uniref:hypothetical protein n=1 Tax=Dyadobacter sp. TaxID=1914288 RepID=UPI001B0A7AF3|nr:hypothetical protein [Dyadobacter sp.]MBO9614692.1 hypothetical protein [Dyadobacter sp.]